MLNCTVLPSRVDSGYMCWGGGELVMNMKIGKLIILCLEGVVMVPWIRSWLPYCLQDKLIMCALVISMLTIFLQYLYVQVVMVDLGK